MNSEKAKTRKFTRENNRWTSTGVGRISGTLTTYLRRKAKERGLAFDVDAAFLWDLFNSQEGKCALSGVPLHLSTTIGKNNNLDRRFHTASLDRIDNSKPYERGNVQWVHKTINQMRRQYTVAEYVQWCSLVASHANSEPSSTNDTQ